MKKTFSFHPYLLAIFPILFLYSHNIGQLSMVSFYEVLIPAAIMLGFTAIAVVVLWLIFKRNSSKAGIVVSIFLVLFFSYGRIYEIIVGFRIGGFIIGGHRYLLALWLIIFIVGTFFTLRTKINLHSLISILNVIAVILVLFSLVNIGIYKFRTRDLRQDISPAPQEEEAAAVRDPGELPDIYYIIMDGYAGSSSLEEFYDYDNHEFIDFLTGKGFFVASESRCNYPWSYLSLASSLNMEYIDFLSEDAGIDSDDRTLPYNMITNNKVWKFLDSMGYQFVHFNSSGWGPTDKNSNADISIRANRFNEFYISLIQTTMLKPLEEYIITDTGIQKVLYSFSNLGKVNQIDGPKYIFAHIMTPHPPFFFDADGGLVPEAEYKLSAYWDREKYLDQLIFVNSKLETLIDEILSGSKVPPVIIIQGDHGARSTLGEPHSDREDPANIGWQYPTAEMLRESTFILNAYYLPDGGSSFLYDCISPVNTFRLVFNTYFDQDYELLEDRSYYSSYWQPYNFYDVTEIKDYSEQP
ncbi:MAG TPA: hypothetical protein DCP02_02280 [Actinobacteria bacterium]|nr:hypothetical protein [Actinomycetota bacterium]